MKKLITIMFFSIGSLISAGTNAESLGDCGINGPALAQCAADWEQVFRNGNKMENTTAIWNTASFQGFTSGVALATLQKRWCPKTGFSSDTVNAIVAKFLREHPELWQARPVELVLAPLAQAFPCGKKARK